MNIKDVLLGLFVAFAWGSFFTVSKLALNSYPPLLLAAMRFFISFLFISPALSYKDTPVKKIFSLSIIITINLAVLNYAIFLSHDIAPIILINELGVPFSIVLGVIFLKESFQCQDMLGVMIALFGAGIVIYTRDISKVGIYAIILTILASMLFALYNLIAKELSSYNILSVLAYLNLFTFPQFFTLSYLQEDWTAVNFFNITSLSALIYIVVVCSLISHYIWLYLFNKYSVSKIVPFSLLSPVFGCISTNLILGEEITSNLFLGGAAVILGISIIECNNSYVRKKL